ncbi:MAG: hypothetical protein ACOYL5_05220 [Phototrophicaceae bacterium]
MIQAESLSQTLALYTWFPIGITLAIYLLIARFYARFSGKRTFYWGFLLPIVLFGASAIRYASISTLTNDLWGDVLLALGGGILLLLTVPLYLQMMSRGHSADDR